MGMDARKSAAASWAFWRISWLAVLLLASMGARRQSANFVVETPDPAFAQQVLQAAETYRRDLAVEWLGKAMPNWAQPCVMTVQAAPRLGNGGATTFIFDRGEVFGWRMSIQGSRERILDSVLPHEITHMIFASHFRQPLPRWADEGGATSVEHDSERAKYRRILNRSLRTGRGIAFNRMFAMTEYPADIMPLYAQGHSLAEFLIRIGGRRKYVEFVGDGLKSDDWPSAVARHYGIQGLGKLQNTWLAWVERGYPALPGTMLADARRPRPAPNLIHRVSGQRPSPDATARLEPVHFHRDATRGSSDVGQGSPYAGQVASNATRGEPQELPSSGWRAVGASVRPPATSSSTQVAHPQPVERP